MELHHQTAAVSNSVAVIFAPVLKEAIRLKVHEGVTWAEAAKRAGMSEAGIHKARKKEHVQALHEHMKAQLIKDVEAERAPLKAQAFIVAADLMHNAKSEAVKARMVEFLAGEGQKGPSVAVQINTGSQPQGYEFVRPGQQVVEIEGAPEAQDVVSKQDE